MEDYLQISPFVYNCKVCPTPCDGVSKMKYTFEKDATFSEVYENKLIDYINSSTNFKAKKNNSKSLP